MNPSFSSLLYASTYGVRFSPEELMFIRSHKDQWDAQRIFENLKPETRESLSKLQWKERWLKVASRPDVQVVTLFCESYPKRLFHLSKPPLVFLFIGRAVWLEGEFLSVVGSRRPFRESLQWMNHHLAPFLASDPASEKWGVVSGGAHGVDQWAHQLCLLAGLPTICVLPSGLNQLYPAQLKPLAEKIVDSGGVLLSGYEIEQPMKKYFFHQRNEWIAALGKSCLVVQANLKSGSLVTANHAVQLGREVLTLPISPWMFGGEGNNRLIKEGAVPVTSKEDLIRGLT